MPGRDSVIESCMQFSAGRSTGKNWAEQAATVQELQRLVDEYESFSSGNESYGWDDMFEEAADIQFVSLEYGGRARWLAKVIEPDADIEYFWSDILGYQWQEVTNDAMFLKGFCQGAMQVCC